MQILKELPTSDAVVQTLAHVAKHLRRPTEGRPMRPRSGPVQTRMACADTFDARCKARGVNCSWRALQTIIPRASRRMCPFAKIAVHLTFGITPGLHGWR